ncbi:hypothetical protein ACFYOT_39300 [Saccharothrix saharensis]|uniref:hypothetical protein n=1 Tax=Saccharothrix saharensis TaxID=571190 RepID=UPI0036AEB573
MCCAGHVAALPGLAKNGVVGVGEIGYDSMTPEEDEAFARQPEWRCGTTCPR